MNNNYIEYFLIFLNLFFFIKAEIGIILYFINVFDIIHF